MMKIAHTYSIVAISEDHSEIGVAVQSHWFAVGAVCPWIQPGIGAIATQSMVETSYGPKGLALLKQGKTASEALADLLSQDPKKALRQVAIIDAAGNTATYTGAKCIAEAGHHSGANYSVQANMMLKNTVWSAMARAFESSHGKLSRRLLSALVAAQQEGGDIRGKQSAAMLVADNILDDKPWAHITTNLRIDDNPDPLKELERLMNIEDAYIYMNEGDEHLAGNEVDLAKEKYAAAAGLAPHIEELRFWEAVALAETGEVESAMPIFELVFRINPQWAVLLQRLPASGLFSSDPALMKKILSVSMERK
jgi:uncharacterized Ntn-hydrolase superfamily protein